MSFKNIFFCFLCGQLQVGKETKTSKKKNDMDLRHEWQIRKQDGWATLLFWHSGNTRVPTFKTKLYLNLNNFWHIHHLKKQDNHHICVVFFAVVLKWLTSLLGKPNIVLVIIHHFHWLPRQLGTDHWDLRSSEHFSTDFTILYSVYIIHYYIIWCIAPRSLLFLCFSKNFTQSKLLF